ncbi:HlyD family efflux transporter periplasmic adaptor subunit [Fusibacter bizertensis]|uniref:HlyD family efflux transporter periplasmic adaptor subunit n=1 Tax=Fusibacter bizertensis TaxID=1488331 RepID=A0ABT6N8G4_9FIRM|nr:HlyD family efflux transporter periplasmic adaptor subunit [Fusibacter bizertensis]MDH8676705.1 HlyD family efflux transporter periplasmic adaptor subunit [Fusibacter bizertensis]
MTKPIRKKRRPKYGRIIMSLAVFGIFIYFIVRLGIDLFYSEQKTYLVEVGNLNIENQYQALVLRNELVVDTNLTGKITYFANEGEVVEKNHQIAEIFNDGSEAIEEEATERELNRKKIEFDYNLLEYDITTLKNEILFQMSAGQYDLIPSLKQELIQKLERLDKLQNENKFLSNRTASYSEKTIGEGALMEGQKQAIYSPASGVLTYKMDGYEDFLTIDNLYNINYDEISSLELQESSLIHTSVKPKDKLFKIVDNANYFIAAVVANEEIDTYKNVQSISAVIDGKTLEGEVYDVFTNNEKAVAVIQLREGFDGFFSRRLINCSIVRENYRGLKIFMDSIVNIDGTIGVYTVDKERKLVFTPVKILGYDDEYAIVYNEQFFDEKTGIVRSIKLNQEVVRDGSKYKTGDRME